MPGTKHAPAIRLVTPMTPLRRHDRAMAQMIMLRIGALIIVNIALHWNVFAGRDRQRLQIIIMARSVTDNVTVGAPVC